jgi:carboxylate-amine ligase
MSAQKEEYTLGVEEEYQIVNPETRGLLARGGHAVQQRAQRALGAEAMPELLTSQIEAISPVCRMLAEVRAEISRSGARLTRRRRRRAAGSPQRARIPFRTGGSSAPRPRSATRALRRATGGWPRRRSCSASTCTSA